MSSGHIASISIPQVKRDIYRGIVDCNARGLGQTVKWLTEMNHCLGEPMAHGSRPPGQARAPPRPNNATVDTDADNSDMIDISSDKTHRKREPNVSDANAGGADSAAASTDADDSVAGAAPAMPSAGLLTDAERNPKLVGVAANELDTYQMAKSYFDCREYKRAAYYTEHCKSPVPQFLFLYATYMAKEKQRLDNMADSSNLHKPSTSNKDVQELVQMMRSMHAQRKLDGYGLYLYGVILKRVDLIDAATRVLEEAVTMVPTLWAAWLELAPLVTDRAALVRVQPLIEGHWMGAIFYGHCLIVMFQNDAALRVFDDLKEAGFARSKFITSQMAMAYHNKRNMDKAIATFENIQEQDPYRLENLDILSNILFVKDMKKELAFLAHRAVEINRYRPETCCVVGNYYSIRAEHQKAIVYFQRALKIDPQYLTAWTLMGHEFMEMKNQNAAIQSYRKTIELSRLDYRAWYGLGQAYEILKMPSFSIYYYKIAQQLRPYDSRMLIALGEAYEKLEKHSNALRCFQKACNVGDIEGIALLRLADLHKKLGNLEAAVPAYLEFCNDERAAVDKGTLCRALVTLGNYYESVGMYDQATHFAYRCLEYEDAKQEARSLLKTIENNRGQQQLRPLAVVAGIPRSTANAAAATASDDAAAAATVAEPTATTTRVSGGAAVAANSEDISMDESDMVLSD